MVAKSVQRRKTVLRGSQEAGTKQEACEGKIPFKGTVDCVLQPYNNAVELRVHQCSDALMSQLP